VILILEGYACSYVTFNMLYAMLYLYVKRFVYCVILC